MYCEGADRRRNLRKHTYRRRTQTQARVHTFRLLRPSRGGHHRRQPLRGPNLEAQAGLLAVQPPKDDRRLFVHACQWHASGLRREIEGGS